MDILDQFPILKFRPEDGDDILLEHSLVEKEQSLFEEMDEATADTLENSELEVYYRVIVPIGLAHGLNKTQAIAFWTRTTFSMFEPG